MYALSADANGLNPVTDQFAAQSYSMVTTIIEPLVSMDAEGAWKPYLAESLTPQRHVRRMGDQGQGRHLLP
ncbi:hypothetical protein ACFSTC_47470 [Nonomuraea ferruginea]